MLQLTVLFPQNINKSTNFITVKTNKNHNTYSQKLAIIFFFKHYNTVLDKAYNEVLHKVCGFYSNLVMPYTTYVYAGQWLVITRNTCVICQSNRSYCIIKYCSCWF